MKSLLMNPNSVLKKRKYIKIYKILKKEETVLEMYKKKRGKDDCINNT